MAKVTVHELDASTTGDVIVLLPVTNVTQVHGLSSVLANEAITVVFQPVS